MIWVEPSTVSQPSELCSLDSFPQGRPADAATLAAETATVVMQPETLSMPATRADKTRIEEPQLERAHRHMEDLRTIDGTLPTIDEVDMCRKSYGRLVPIRAGRSSEGR